MPNAGFAFWAYSDPVSAQQGDFYYNITTAKWRFYNNGSWQNAPFTFTKGGVAQSPSAGLIVLWVAPEPCTVTKVRAYQDTGTGSVLTAYKNGSDLLATDITIITPAAWTTIGGLQNTAFAAGDSLAMKVVSVAGSPNYVTVQVDFTDP